MDALKRAEKARQAEASSDGAELDLAATQGFSLDPIDESASGERPMPREPTLDQPVSQSQSEDRSGLSLEDTQAVHGRLGTEVDESQPLEDTGGRSMDDSISIIDDEEAVDGAHTLPNDTSATLPSIRQAQRSVDSYFDGTGSASMTRDDIASAMSESTAPQQRAPGDTETQRRVRAVFHAKEASRGQRNRNWVVVGLLPLLLLIVVGGSVFLFWDSIQETLFGKPALVQNQRPVNASGQGQPANTKAPVVTASSSQPASSAGQPASGSATGTGSTNPPPAPAAPPSPSGATTADKQSDGTGGAAKQSTQGVAQENTAAEREQTRPAPEAPPPTADEMLAQSPASGSGSGSGRTLSAEETVQAAIERAGLAPASPTGGGAFKITRERKPDRLHPRLAGAYDAWRSGNLADARRGYESVLRSDPRNRNALLGLGAIAVRNGQWDEASQRYTQLLRLNPKDSVAQAGLIAVHENVDPLRAESQIKLLLRDEPDAPHLHFTLGNTYADQGRWGEAQSAYFDAYRLDSENSDYAYNVAVSLDQLGKGKAAADYYRRALELAVSNGAAFDQPSVRDRLLALTYEAPAQ